MTTKIAPKGAPFALPFGLFTTLIAILLLAACSSSGSGGGIDVTGTNWSDSKAPGNTFAFEENGICEAKGRYRNFAGRWVQNGNKVDFTISGDIGQTVFHMVIHDKEMQGDAFPPGEVKSLFVNLVKIETH